MNVEYINPFVEATSNVFKTMLGLEPVVHKPYLRNREDPNQNPKFEICALIGISGKERASVVVGCQLEVARKIVGKFVGLSEVENFPLEDVSDGIGEVVNLIAGGAKAGLSLRIDSVLSISVPNVVVGDDIQIVKMSQYPSLIIPFSGEIGDFAVEVSFHSQKP